eukprot:Gb_11750 [translate_table: standard]
MNGGRRNQWMDSRRDFPRWSSKGKLVEDRKQSKISTGFWKPTVPSWEKEFCKSVGLPWKDLCDAKRLIDEDGKVLRWEDSAAEEAFIHAKKRYWAKCNGIRCESSLLNPDLYIDEIDWNSQNPGDFDWPDKSDSGSEEEMPNRNNWWKENERPTFIMNELPVVLTGWGHPFNFGGDFKEVSGSGWEDNDDNEGNVTDWEHNRETEWNSNMRENWPSNENPVVTSTVWGNNNARYSHGNAFQNGNGWSRVPGKNWKNKRWHGRNSRPTKIFFPQEQNISTGRGKHLHCPSNSQYQKQPFAPRHWNNIPQNSQQRPNPYETRMNPRPQALYNSNWGNASFDSNQIESRGFNHAVDWRFQPQYMHGSHPASRVQRQHMQGSYPAPKVKIVPKKNGNFVQGDTPVSNYYIQKDKDCRVNIRCSQR